jgi:hypothetical protein
MQTQDVLNSIFDKMPEITKCQRDFLQHLFSSLFAMQGRVNFTNLARYMPLHEQTLRRHFEKQLDWPLFNQSLIGGQPTSQIGVFDCSFIPKSGKATFGLDRFWSSTHRRAQRGLEISVLGLIDLKSEQAWTLDVTQTPPGLSCNPEGYSRVDFYLEQITDCLAQLFYIQHFVADGYYAKLKIFDTLTGLGKHVITRLRNDANLRYLSDGERKAGQKGPTARYAGKVDWQDVSRFDYVGALEDKPEVVLYTQVLNSPHFKRDFRVVVLLNTKTNQYVVLASTDIEQSAHQIVAYYRLRFQIEFLFRDAKQFTGLCHCQARDENKLDFHFNMSLTAVNLAQLVMAQQGICFNDYVRLAYNRFLVTRLLEQLGLEAEFEISDPRIENVIHTGRMAA